MPHQESYFEGIVASAKNLTLCLSTNLGLFLAVIAVERATGSTALRVGLVISVVMLFVVGLYPQPFIELLQLSSRLM